MSHPASGGPPSSQAILHPSSFIRHPLLYLSGIDLPMPQARAVQTLHTAHAMARLGCPVLLAVGRAPRAGLAEVLTQYGLAPHPNLRFLSLPSLRLPKLPDDRWVHPRLAVTNWSFGLAALLALRLLPSERRPRLVFARDPRLAWIFLQARPWLGAEVAYEVHELFSTDPRHAERAAPARSSDHAGPTDAIPAFRVPRIRRLEQSVLRDSKHLFTLTQACRQIVLDEFGAAPERVTVAADAVAVVPPELPPRAPDGRTVVYAGQLYPWKGVGTLVRALTLLPDARLRIIGGLAPDDPHAAALRELAVAEGVFERIEFTGFLPHARVEAAVGGAAAAAVPLPDNPMSRYFTSPLKVFEYMAAGLPIVASDLPALRDVLRHEENALLVPPDDPPALAAALGRLLVDPMLADRLRARAHADVATHTWDARARSMLTALGLASPPIIRPRPS